MSNSRFARLLRWIFLETERRDSVDGILAEHKRTVDLLANRSIKMIGEQVRIDDEMYDKRKRLELEIAELTAKQGAANFEQRRADAATAQLNQVFVAVDGIEAEAV